VKALFLSAGLAAAGCTASSNDIQIRPLADPGSKLGTNRGLLADATAQLNMGNVGLALEGFRKALREQPDSIAALGGIAACYDAMGRYDLSRLNYEAALAIAPSDPVLLNSFAASLDHQGKRSEAAAVRAEVAELASASEALDRTQAAPDEPVAPVAIAVRQLAPGPTVIQVKGPSVTVALPAARPVEAPRELPIPAPALRRAAVDLPSASAPRLEQLSRMSAASITVALPEASAAQAPLEVPIPAPMLRQVAVDLPQAQGPRLERLSPGVVALITIEQPRVQPRVVARTATSTTVRWVPVATAGVLGRPNIRLLNAARRQGLAARTRGYLLDRGWRKIEIGDATEMRERSIVFYPASRRTTGRSLAAQFGFASAVQRGDVLVVLLGRDAAGRAFQIRG
jgi:hypothetical protein